MINKDQLQSRIVEPTLKLIGLYSPVAVNLLMGTCAQESGLGTYLYQVGTGPALGIYQMEPNTYNDIWDNFLRYKPALSLNITRLAILSPDSEEMVGNLYFATAMCRAHYLRAPAPLPTDPNDIAGLAAYWKRYYNTPQGAGTEAQFIANYKKYLA